MRPPQERYTNLLPLAVELQSVRQTPDLYLPNPAIAGIPDALTQLFQ